MIERQRLHTFGGGGLIKRNSERDVPCSKIGQSSEVHGQSTQIQSAVVNSEFAYRERVIIIVRVCLYRFKSAQRMAGLCEEKKFTLDR